MTKLTKREWTIIIIGGIVSFIMFKVLDNLPKILDWISQNLVLIGIIALIVYIIKNNK